MHFRTEQTKNSSLMFVFQILHGSCVALVLGALECMKHSLYCSMICTDLLSIPQENETLQDRLKQADLFYFRVPVLYSIDQNLSEFVPPFCHAGNGYPST